jgi:RNA 2',3'-cyclic 3'-phosphodiesterase
MLADHAGGVIRSFVAVELAGSARSELQSYLDALRGIDGVAWTRLENLHITLKFLGNVARDRLERLAPRLAEVAAGRSPFTITCAGVGAFPSLARPRVLWAGADARPLAALAADVDEACIAEGFVPETRPFHAHCTLGQLRPPGRGRGQRRRARHPSAGIVGLLDRLGAERTPAFGVSPASALVLFRSDTSATGARYTALATFPFGPAPQDASRGDFG